LEFSVGAGNYSLDRSPRRLFLLLSVCTRLVVLPLTINLIAAKIDRASTGNSLFKILNRGGVRLAKIQRQCLSRTAAARPFRSTPAQEQELNKDRHRQLLSGETSKTGQNRSGERSLAKIEEAR
jgi:hypothetical protein